MTLDKQRILSELGNVVNQLQSADCGCMGKLFSNSNQCPNNQGNPQSSYGGCGYNSCHGHGHHGWKHGSNAPCAGDPNSGNRHCMGSCNPPKLYSDTYNYLNHNLMQPVVKDVYNDLKTITPANTMMNNPIGSQMGMPVQGNAASPDTRADMMAQNQMSSIMSNQNNMPAMGYTGYTQNNANSGMSNMNMSSNMQMNTPNAMQQKMGGMGPQILNMMMSEGAKSNGMSNQIGQSSSPMGGEMSQLPHDRGMATTNMADSGAGNTGYNSANMHGIFNSGQNNTGGMHAYGNLGQYNTNSIQSSGNQGQYHMSDMGMSSNQMQNMTAQHAMQQTMYGLNAAGNKMTGNTSVTPQQMTSTAPTPAHQQMAAQHQSHAKYGQHSAGMAKFKEMFPGVMQGLGGDLGFDPMSIAIQMNPSNQQQAAMDTMNKMMMGKKEGISRVHDGSNKSAFMQPAINGANAAAASLGQPSQPPTTQMQQNPPDVYQQISPNAQPMNSTYQMGSVQQLGGNSSAAPQQYYQTKSAASAGMVPSRTQQQVYTTVSGAPTMNRQVVPLQQQQQSQLYQQQRINPNGPFYDNSGDLNSRLGEASSQHQYVKDPIFPANASNRPTFNNMVKPTKQTYEYNTLGQPIQMLPAKMYATPEPDLPQTLSPQQVSTKLRHDPNRYSNVKSTISKTSLMGNKPLGKTPSRNQLQHIYNQYRGSQSFTQQNFKQSNRNTHSAGDLNVVQNNAPRQEAIEKVAGDTVYNSQMNEQLTNKVEHVIGRMGDVPANNKPGDIIENQASPSKQGRCRNGLQDMVFTSYPTSAAWSFHGNNQVPVRSGYRYRK